MAQWGARRKVVFISEHESEDEKKPLLTSQDNRPLKTSEPLVNITKRKRRNRTQLKEVKAQTQTPSNHTSKKRNCQVDRWSAER